MTDCNPKERKRLFMTGGMNTVDARNAVMSSYLIGQSRQPNRSNEVCTTRRKPSFIRNEIMKKTLIITIVCILCTQMLV